jgi:hypothetical protein
MATTDVLSTAEALAAVNLSTESTGRLTLLVSAVSQQLDELCGPVVQRTITSESYDGGEDELYLLQRPVVSVTGVTEYRNTTAQALAAESNTSKTGYDYVLEEEWGVLRRRSSNQDAPFPAGRRNVVVTYVAGRATNTAAVDAKFKQAAAMMLRNLWVSEAASGSETIGAFTDQIAVNPLLGPGMLNKVAALLSGEMKAPSV